MASALWVTGFAIGIAFGVACVSILIDVGRALRAVWGAVLAAHANARPPEPQVRPLRQPAAVRRRVRPARRTARQPAGERHAARRRLAA